MATLNQFCCYWKDIGVSSEIFAGVSTKALPMLAIRWRDVGNVSRVEATFLQCPQNISTTSVTLGNIDQDIPIFALLNIGGFSVRQYWFRIANSSHLQTLDRYISATLMFRRYEVNICRMLQLM